MECLCEKHFEQNLVNLNLDFASKPKFNLCFENINFNVLSKIPLTKEKYISSYVVEIKINKVNIHRHFPLIVVKDAKTNTNKNRNDYEGHIMVVDNITLEDFVKYHNNKTRNNALSLRLLNLNSNLYRFF